MRNELAHFSCFFQSPRRFYWALRDIELRRGGKHTQPPVSLLGQLLWREFFYTVGAGTPNFDRMSDNELCKPVPWNADEKLLQAYVSYGVFVACI